jgi:gluconate kinase
VDKFSCFSIKIKNDFCDLIETCASFFFGFLKEEKKRSLKQRKTIKGHVMASRYVSSRFTFV